MTVTLGAAQAPAPFPHLDVPAASPDLDPTLPVTTWNAAATATLAWDVASKRTNRELATALLSSDGTALYVRFDVVQSEPIAATQHTNDVGQGSDDSVWIDLWPNGAGGYMYQFIATPNGTHYQSSTENTSYAPAWLSRGAARVDGYTVTMRIPLDVMRGADASHPWNVQLVRYVHASGVQEVWSHDASQTSPDDFTRAGSMTLSQPIARPSRPKPRLATYVLGEAASKAIGGSTSRVGLDVSIPVAPTASFYATLHPDYSNVELDQQTILPTVSARFYNEVRPFFTQGANFYNQINCYVCPQLQELYTPAIPTPAQGYAIEGKQGPLGFAAFDAIGDGRSDVASALDFTSQDQHWSGTVQRVSVNTSALADDVTTGAVQYNDLKHVLVYFDYGSDSGTNVLVPDQAQRYDFGGGWGDQTFALFGALRKVGTYYNPVDGYVWHPGVAGYGLYSAKIWDFGDASKLASVGISGFIDRYQAPQGGIAQSDNQALLDILTKSAWDVQLFSGSDYWRFGDAVEPISQSAGFSVTYHSGVQTNNANTTFPNHGASATPTTIAYNTGRYGTGRLDTWFRTTTIRAGSRGTITLALDDTAQYEPVGQSNVQWFESASFAYQISSDSSLAVGLRRVIGEPPIPNGGGNCLGSCSNVSVAYHLRLRHTELYLAYGNPNALVTVPQAIFKAIFYAGADKGT